MITKVKIDDLKLEIESLLNNRPADYGPDKCVILSDKSKEDLNDLNIKKSVRRFATSFSVQPPSAMASINGTKSSLCSVALSKNGVTELRTFANSLKPYSFSCFELSQDTPYLERENVKLNPDTYFPVGDDLVLKLGKIYKEIFGINYERYFSRRPLRNKGAVSLYFNFTLNFILVIYARLSKLIKNNGLPVIHIEFRVKTAREIKAKLGIKTVTDWRNLRYSKVFALLMEKQIRKNDLLEVSTEEVRKDSSRAEIDYLKVALFEQGIHGNTNLDKDFNQLNYNSEFRRPYVKAKFYGRYFCYVYNLKSPDDVYEHYIYFKQNLRSKRGRKTSRENNIIKLKSRGTFAVK